MNKESESLNGRIFFKDFRIWILIFLITLLIIDISNQFPV